jgi:Uma2 family endonuclease
MSQLAERVYTAEEYLALEREAAHKSEFVKGRIYAMTGASIPHSRIAGNLFGVIWTKFRDGPCSVFANDVRVKSTWTEMYTYPDIVALCDPPLLEDEHADTLLNPAVIIEVLSESTERYDRGEKFAHYRKIESLREYILVAQDQVRVEQYVRHGEHWTLSEIDDLAGSLRIETLGCEVPLRDIYDRVEFSE